MEGFESVSNGFGAIVVSDVELLATLVAYTINLRLDIFNVVGSTAGANSASAHSCDDLIVGNLNGENHVDLNAHCLKGFSLRNGSGKPSSMKPFLQASVEI